MFDLLFYKVGRRAGQQLIDPCLELLQARLGLVLSQRMHRPSQLAG